MKTLSFSRAGFGPGIALALLISAASPASSQGVPSIIKKGLGTGETEEPGAPEKPEARPKERRGRGELIEDKVVPYSLDVFCTSEECLAGVERYPETKSSIHDLRVCLYSTKKGVRKKVYWDHDGRTMIGDIAGDHPWHQLPWSKWKCPPDFYSEDAGSVPWEVRVDYAQKYRARRGWRLIPRKGAKLIGSEIKPFSLPAIGIPECYIRKTDTAYKKTVEGLKKAKNWKLLICRYEDEYGVAENYYWYTGGGQAYKMGWEYTALGRVIDKRQTCPQTPETGKFQNEDELPSYLPPRGSVPGIPDKRGDIYIPCDAQG